MRQSITYLLDPSDLIIDIQGPWDQFAQENGWPGGTQDQVVNSLFWDHLADRDTQQFYKTLFSRLRRMGRPFAFQTRCDGPEVKRYLKTWVIPNSGGEISMVNEVIKEVPRSLPFGYHHQREAKDHLAVKCSICNKVKVGEDWLELEEVVAQVRLTAKENQEALVSGICPPCLEPMKVI